MQRASEREHRVIECGAKWLSESELTIIPTSGLSWILVLFDGAVALDKHTGGAEYGLVNDCN